jgi:hypothetical protein
VDLTELITFNLLKPQRDEGLATIMRQAELVLAMMPDHGCVDAPRWPGRRADQLG